MKQTMAADELEQLRDCFYRRKIDPIPESCYL